MNPPNRRVSQPPIRVPQRAVPPTNVPLPPKNDVSDDPKSKERLRNIGVIVRVVLGAAIVFAVSSSVAWAARRYVVSTSRFEVTEIIVEGGHYRTPDVLAKSAGLETGTNIFSLDLDNARARLLLDPWISEATLARRLPGTILLQVTEREVAAIVALGDSYLVSREGEIFKKVEPGDPSDLPVITGLSSDAMSEDRDGSIKTIRRALDLASDFEHGPLAQKALLQEVHLEPGGGISLVVGKREQTFTLALGEAPFHRKLEQAARVLAELDKRGTKARAIMLDNEVRPERVVVRTDR